MANHPVGTAIELRALREPTRPPLGSKLIAVATGLFAEKGFDRTTVADIMRKAGVTKGALYHYFTSKDDLLSEVYTRVLRMQMRRLRDIADNNGPILERIRAADVATTRIENIDDTRIFWQSMHHFGEEQQRGVRTGVPVDILLDYFFGAVHHVTWWYHADGPLTPEAVEECFAELLMSGITKAPEKPH